MIIEQCGKSRESSKTSHRSLALSSTMEERINFICRFNLICPHFYKLDMDFFRVSLFFENTLCTLLGCDTRNIRLRIRESGLESLVFVFSSHPDNFQLAVNMLMYLNIGLLTINITGCLWELNLTHTHTKVYSNLRRHLGILLVN